MNKKVTEKIVAFYDRSAVKDDKAIEKWKKEMINYAEVHNIPESVKQQKHKDNRTKKQSTR